MGAKAGPSGAPRALQPFTVAELREELTESLDELLEKNFESFSRKFEIQKRQVVEDVKKALGREGDRIIAAVTTGVRVRPATR